MQPSIQEKNLPKLGDTVYIRGGVDNVLITRTYRGMSDTGLHAIGSLGPNFYTRADFLTEEEVFVPGRKITLKPSSRYPASNIEKKYVLTRKGTYNVFCFSYDQDRTALRVGEETRPETYFSKYRNIFAYNKDYIIYYDEIHPEFRKQSTKDTETDTKKENTTMSKIIDMVKSDTKEAAYRVAGTQITNGAKAALIKLFESRGGSSEQMTVFRSLLDSEMGESIIAMMLGVGLKYAPMVKDDQRVQKLAEEFRVQGMTTAGNAVMEMAMGSILPVLTTALNSLPEETNAIRVGEEEEEEEKSLPAAKSATR